MAKICKQSIIYSLGAAVYIILVALFMGNANAIFGQTDTVVSSVAFLLLLVLSALVVGSLMVGKPIMLYLDNKKKDAVLMIAANAGWLLLFFILALVVLAIIR